MLFMLTSARRNNIKIITLFFLSLMMMCGSWTFFRFFARQKTAAKRVKIHYFFLCCYIKRRLICMIPGFSLWFQQFASYRSSWSFPLFFLAFHKNEKKKKKHSLGRRKEHKFYLWTSLTETEHHWRFMWRLVYGEQTWNLHFVHLLRNKIPVYFHPYTSFDVSLCIKTISRNNINIASSLPLLTMMNFPGKKAWKFIKRSLLM